MHDPAAGKGQAGLDGVQLTVSRRQQAGLAAEDEPLIQQPGPLEPRV